MLLDTSLSLSVAFTISQMVLVLDDKFKGQEQEFNMQQLDYENQHLIKRVYIFLLGFFRF